MSTNFDLLEDGATYPANVPTLDINSDVQGASSPTTPPTAPNNFGDGNAPHVALANRTKYLNEKKVAKAGDTMTGDLTMQDAGVKVKDTTFQTWAVDKNGRRLIQVVSKDMVHEWTVGKKGLVIVGKNEASIIGTGLTSGELVLVQAVIRDLSDSATAYSVSGLIEYTGGGNRNYLVFAKGSGFGDQYANKGYNATTDEFEIFISATGIIGIKNEFSASKTIDVIVKASLLV